MENKSLANVQEVKNVENSMDHYELSSLEILEKKLKRLEEIIENFDKIEMSLEDMEQDDSPFLKRERVVNKYLELWKQYRRLIDKSDGRSKLYKNLNVTRSKYAQINEGIKQHLVKKKKFPDYPEIRRIVSDINRNLNLGMNAQLVNFESSELFNEVGMQLQKNRKNSLKKSTALLFKDGDLEKITKEDPAEKDHSLKHRLTENSRKFSNELDQIFREYAVRSLEEAETLDADIKGTNESEAELTEETDELSDDESSSKVEALDENCALSDIDKE